MPIRRLLAESLTVAVAGGILAFAANALSPRGLSISRDYFPGGARPLRSAAAATSNQVDSAQTALTNHAAMVKALTARLKEQGLQVADSNQVYQLYQDARYQQGLIIFIDSRDDAHYQAGHVPGAHQFDHYQPQNYLAAVLPATQAADQIVVYCNGGDCEDSEFAAKFLRDSAGVAGAKLTVYIGGMTEWEAAGWPVETGARNSGVLLEKKQ